MSLSQTRNIITDERTRLGNAFSPSNSHVLAREILELKRDLNAVILAHNYQVPEIQDLADFASDSPGLAQQAAKTPAEVIVFCGVHFMAETAKILNPDQRVHLRANVRRHADAIRQLPVQPVQIHEIEHA